MNLRVPRAYVLLTSAATGATLSKGTSLVKNLHKGEKYVHRKYIAFKLTLDLDVDADVVNVMK